ncbi:MAG: FAD-binding protein [Acidobacteriaceae bacterium]|nr:FAD-binding protein [Acidobacteriaceae bacterium]
MEISMEALERLRRRLAGAMTGSVSLPGEPAYVQAVSIWAKPRILPRLVAHCANVADVQLAIRSARDAGLALSVRGGGHNWTGCALCDGLTLDLSRMNAAGPIGRDATIAVGGGAKGTHVFAVTDPAGMAPVLGSVADIGLAGLVTGGGYGPLMRQFGLACDNLRAATVVLADGQQVRAAEDGDSELYWAIRGGGGNFGVVTSMELHLRPLASVRSGILLFPFDSGDSILPRLSEIWANAPLELDVQIGIVPAPDGAPVVYLSPTWSGDPGGADAALAPLYANGDRIAVDIRDQPFGSSRAFFDQYIVKGLVTSADTLWLREWNDEIAGIVMDAMRRRPSQFCFVLCHDFSGAAAEISAPSTAFGLRKPHIWFEIIAPADPDRESDGRVEADWARGVTESLVPFAFPGGYPNLLGPSQHDRIQSSFGENASRLLAAKKTYDPENMFRSAIPLPDAGLS